MTQSPFYVWKTHSVAKSFLPKDAPVPPRIVPGSRGLKSCQFIRLGTQRRFWNLCKYNNPGTGRGVWWNSRFMGDCVVGSPFFFLPLHRCSFAGWPDNLLYSLVLKRRVKIERGVHSPSSNTLAVDPPVNTVGQMGHPFCRGTRAICACLY